MDMSLNRDDIMFMCAGKLGQEGEKIHILLNSFDLEVRQHHAQHSVLGQKTLWGLLASANVNGQTYQTHLFSYH